MRICVVGPGAIGGVLAVRLSRSGNDVSVLARGPSLHAIQGSGITLLEPDGGRVIATEVRASDSAASLGRHDLVLLAVKAHQVAEVAGTIPQLIEGDSVVLTLQNGIPWWFFQKFPGRFEGRRLLCLDPDGVLERTIPTDRLLGSIAYPAAERTAPGVVRLVEGDRFPVGELDGEVSTRATSIAAVLADAGFTSKAVRDIRSHLWVKAWGNLAFNPISALTGATLSEICHFGPARELATRMMHESAAIAEQLGLRLRLSVEQRIEGAARVGAHKTSMLQDVEAGRALELEAIVGAFVELGRLTDTPTPTIDTVYGLTATLDARIRAHAAAHDDARLSGR